MADVFEFSSGGAYHPKGFGEWIIRLEGNKISIRKNIKGKVKDFGVFQLTEVEYNTLINIIDLTKFTPSTRPGEPDECMLTFSRDNKKFEIWSNDASDDPNLTLIIRFIMELIKRYADEKPIF